MPTVIPPNPLYNRFNIPDGFRKGEEFEDFVLRTFFPPEYYTLVNRTANYLQNAARFQESLQPDFTLRDHETGIEFFIECKYRYSLIANSFHFSKSHQVERYKTYTNKPFFLVLGLGGAAGKPNEVYLANFKDCPYMHLFKRHLRNKAVQINMPILSEKLWKYESSIALPDKKIA